MKIILLSVILFLSYVKGKVYPILIPAKNNISSDVKLTYLMRSGWLAETANHLLLFDYVPYDGKNFDEFIQLEFNKAVRNKKNLFIFFREQNFCSKLSLKAIDFALAQSPISCIKFIEGLGLKFLFPVLMNRGIKEKKVEEQMRIDGKFKISKARLIIS